MAKARSPNRNKAFEIWRDSCGKIPLKDIAQKLNASDSLIRKWKNIDQWDSKLNGNVTNGDKVSNGNVTDKKIAQKSKIGAPIGNKNAAGHGAPKGNKNALGNNGGAPNRNTNAVKTGEHQTLWLEYLTEEEQDQYQGISVDKLEQIDEDIRLLTWRENLMMKRIHKLKDGVDNVEIDTVEEACVKIKPVQVYDEKAGRMIIKNTITREMQVVEVRKKEKSMIAEILRVEEALTRVQDKKAKLIQAKHKIELDYERLALERRKVDILESKTDIDLMIRKDKYDNGDKATGVTIIDDIPEVDDDECQP